MSHFRASHRVVDRVPFAYLCAAVLLTGTPTLRAEEPAAAGVQKMVGFRRGQELPATLSDGRSIQALQASPNMSSNASDGGIRGACPPIIKAHTDANFGGGSFVVQGGLAETEIAAAQFTIPAIDFPLRIDLIEMIWATSGATVETTTEWGVRVWSGPPNTGALVHSADSDGFLLPHLVLPPGTNGANIQYSVEPPPQPEQIIVQAPGDGSNSFTVGYRINQHHQQTGNPCFEAPPSCCNAFPTTDTSGLQQPANNWVFAVNCGQFGCPANGGWARFSQLPGFCRPSGDWVIRVTYTPTFCAGVGACCAANGTCTATTQANCTGAYQGDGTSCTPNPCPQPSGACCLSDGSCVDEVTQPVCTANGGTYQGDDSLCSGVSCPQPTEACCFGAGPGTCLNETLADCNFIGGEPQGFGTVCLANDSCPLGACCMPDGSCTDDQSAADCEGAGGIYQNDLSQCSGVSCPQPTGACCLSNGNCIVRTQAQCAIITDAEWAGPFTNCADGNANGQADECEAAGVPAATVTSVISRKTCDLTVNLNGRVQNADVTTESRDGRIDHVRIGFNVAPGGPGPSPVTILQQTGCPTGSQAAYGPYSGSSSITPSIVGNELVLLFTPGLENARTYKFQLSGAPLTSVTGQAFELRGLRSDVNSTGTVDATDRSVVVSVWTGPGFTCLTDIDLSGQTNASDRSIVVSAWTGGPSTNCAP